MTTQTRKPKITFIRDKRGFPVACVAFSMESDPTLSHPTLALKYAFSVYNADKDKFDRERARDVAIERFNNEGRGTVKFLHLREKTTLREALRQLMERFAIDTKREIPTRLRKAAKNYIRYTKEKQDA